MGQDQKYREEKILKRVLGGDRKACEILVNKYKDYVFSLVLNIVNNRELAEEVTQDTFLKMFNALSTFEKRAKFSTWLYSIASRSAIDAARKRKKDLGFSGSEELMLNKPADQLNPEREMLIEGLMINRF